MLVPLNASYTGQQPQPLLSMNMADNEYSQSHDRIPNSANPRNNRGGPNRDRGNPQYDQGGPNRDRGNPQYDQGGPNRDRGNPQYDRGGPNRDRGNPQYDRGGPNPDRGNPQYDRGGPNPDRGNPQYDRGGPNQDRGNPQYYQGGPYQDRGNPQYDQGGPNRDRGNPQYNRGGPPRGGRGGRRGQGEYRGPNRPPAYTQVQQSDGDDSDLESWVSDSTTVGDIRSLDDFDDSVGRFGYKRGGRGGGRIRGSTPVRGQPMNTRFDDPTETNGNMKDGVGPASNRGRYQDGGNKKRNRNRKKQEKGNVDSGDVIKDCVDGMKKTKQINIIRLDDITTVDTKILINRVQSNSLKVEQLKEEGATKAELKERRKQIAIIQKEIKSRKEKVF